MNISPLSASEQKFQEWQVKRRLYIKDTIIKVAKTALQVFLAVACVVVPAALGASLWMVPGALLAIGGMTYAFYRCWDYDWSNYYKPSNVDKIFATIHRAALPISMGKMKRYHRYGFVSDKEMSVRKQLEEAYHEYNENLLRYAKASCVVECHKNDDDLDLDQVKGLRDSYFSNGRQIQEKFIQFQQSIIAFEI